MTWDEFKDFVDDLLQKLHKDGSTVEVVVLDEDGDPEEAIVKLRGSLLEVR